MYRTKNEYLGKVFESSNSINNTSFSWLLLIIDTPHRNSFRARGCLYQLRRGCTRFDVLEYVAADSLDNNYKEVPIERWLEVLLEGTYVPDN